MSGDAEVSGEKCGFELSPAPLDTWEDDVDGWDVADDVVRCCRDTWQETGRCVWHAEVEGKPIENSLEALSEGSNRIDGAYFIDVESDEPLSFQNISLRYAEFQDTPLGGAKFQDTSLGGAKFQDTSLGGAKFQDTSLLASEFQDTSLGGAKFQDTSLDLAEFRGDTSLDLAEFRDTSLREAEFQDTSLINAEFQNTSLKLAEFRNTSLREAEFQDTSFRKAEFQDTSLREAEFQDTSLINAEFQNTSLKLAEFQNTSLKLAEFQDTYLGDAEFQDTSLDLAEFRGDTSLRRAEFQDCDLSNADCTDVDARGADFTHATLHATLLTRADCRAATFTNALLYEAVLADTRINSQTTFYDPNLSRPKCVYEENPETSEDLPEDTTPLEAAEWVYRRLEKLHDENALSEEAREFHISKEEARRKQQSKKRDDAYEEFREDINERDVDGARASLTTALQWEARHFVSSLQWHLTRHGESIKQIFVSAAALIVACGILYPFVGGFESNSNGATYRIWDFSLGSFGGIPFPQINLLVDGPFEFLGTLLQSIYFSVITFTTIGYGDLYPTGVGSKILVGFESLSGAILIALFVFVLGRRVAR